MKPIHAVAILVTATCLFTSCFTQKKVAEDGTVTTTRTPITTLKPNSANPSQSVINASGDALTIGIPNGNDLRAGSSENATTIANNAIAKVNGPMGVNQQRLDSLTSIDFMNKIAVHQMTMIKLSTLVQSKSPDKKVMDFAKVMLVSQEAEQNDLHKLSGYKKVALPGTVNVTQQASNLSPTSYIQLVIEDQESAIRFFEVGNKSKDPEIRAFAAKYLPISKKHLQDARAILK